MEVILMIKKITKKRTKQATLAFLAAIMTQGALAPAFSLTASAAAPAYTIELGEGEITVETSDALIAVLEQYLTVEDGKFVFDHVPFHVYAQFGHELVQGFIDGIQVVNEQAENGEIRIHEDLSIVELNEDGTIVRRPRSNVTETTSHWWGIRFRFNRTATRTAILDLQRAANNSNLAAGVAAVFTAKAAGVGGLPFLFSSWQHNSKADALQRRLNETTNRGTELDLHHGITWATRAQ